MSDIAAAPRLDYLTSVSWVLRLARPAGLGDAPPSWEGILDVAIEERCAALAWLRSGSYIREHAPPAEVARWRAFAVANDAFTRAQIRALCEVVDALRVNGVEPTVLKGVPLALRLYGDATARTMDDIDVYVRPSDRARSARILAEEGWKPHYSESMLDDCYRRCDEAGDMYLEVHTAIVSELLSHIDLGPLETGRVEIDGRELRAVGGATLPVYLSAHLAKHPFPSLLWLVDFDALWRSLPAADRRRAAALAAARGLQRWLAWSVDRLPLLEPATRGDGAALRALGFGERGRCTTHGIREFVRHSDSALDAARVIGAIAWPRHLRRDVPGFIALSARRARDQVRRAIHTAGGAA